MTVQADIQPPTNPGQLSGVPRILLAVVFTCVGALIGLTLGRWLWHDSGPELEYSATTFIDRDGVGVPYGVTYQLHQCQAADLNGPESSAMVQDLEETLGGDWINSAASRNGELIVSFDRLSFDDSIADFGDRVAGYFNESEACV